MRLKRVAGIGALAGLLASVSAGWEVQGQTHWPQFRGPGAAGVGRDVRLPDTWSATENV